MDKITQRLKVYIETHPIDLGDSECETVLDQLYQAYAESHESDPPEINNGFKELEEFLCTIPLEDNNYSCSTDHNWAKQILHGRYAHEGCKCPETVYS